MLQSVGYLPQLGRFGRLGRVMSADPWPRFDYYVDSAAGSDSNTGRSASAPFATWAAAFAAAGNISGKRFAGKRGSVFLEEADLGTASYVEIGHYGNPADPLPTWDGADEIEGTWTLVSGETLVWEVEIPSDGVTVNCGFNIWRNGVALKWVNTNTNLDEIRSTAGSFSYPVTSADEVYHTTPIPSPVVLRMHAPCDYNPNTDGALYEVSIRKHAISLGTGDGNWVWGQCGKRSLHKDGPFWADRGLGHRISNCLLVDCFVHGWYLPGDAIGENCLNISRGIRRGGDYIFHKVSGVHTAVARNLYKYHRQTTYSEGDCPAAFYAHTSGGSVKYSSILWDTMYAKNIDGSMFINADLETPAVIRNAFGRNVVEIASGASNSQIERSTFILDFEEVDYSPTSRFIDTNSASYAVDISDSRLAMRPGANSDWSFARGGNNGVTVRRSTIVYEQNGFTGNKSGPNCDTASKTITSEQNVLVGTLYGHQAYSASITTVADSNVYVPQEGQASQKWKVANTDYTGLAAVQALGLDTDSVVSTRGTVLTGDPFDNDWSLGSVCDDLGGLEAGGRYDIVEPDWEALAVKAVAGFLAIDGTGPEIPAFAVTKNSIMLTKGGLTLTKGA